MSKLLKYWLLFGIAALALAGLFALLLVAARSPVVQDLIPLNDIFHKALTVHVNLSVLVWFLSMTCVFWQMIAPGEGKIDLLIFYGAVAGVILFVLSPVLEEGNALLNNYVPILDNAPFKVGIGIFLAAITVQAALTLHRFPHGEGRDSLFNRAILVSALIYLLAMAAILWSYADLADPELGFNSAQFYESFFWGGGHILQFLYTQVMLLAWWRLSGVTPENRTLLTVTFAINPLLSLAGLVSYFIYPAHEPEHIALFTVLMRDGAGIAPIMLGILLFPCLRKKGTSRILLCSIAMFAAGGALGFMIHGANTIIPAHYHGSIVAVTLALMGLAYTLLPELGFASVPNRFLTLQAYIYSIGQFLHITGLAWSGGYGALRKTPGAMASLEGQTAMGLMGLGGLLSVIGGLMFVILCARSLLNRPR